MNIIKQSQREKPIVSICLVDWGVREKFFALEWLNRQTFPRDKYEIIWVDCYKTQPASEIYGLNHDLLDCIIECEQNPLYHKHKAYNVALGIAKGDIFTVMDSDAVASPDFIKTIAELRIVPSEELACDDYHYQPDEYYMHWEHRCSLPYPEVGFKDMEDLYSYTSMWWPPWPNVGACFSCRREDAIRFGGFDEDESYRGYSCGAYELAWRMVNAGFIGTWYSPLKACLYHFAHPGTSQTPRPRDLDERKLEIFGHNFAAVQGFSQGRILPLTENARIHSWRLAMRKMPSAFEAEYSALTDAEMEEIRKILVQREAKRILSKNHATVSRPDS